MKNRTLGLLGAAVFSVLTAGAYAGTTTLVLPGGTFLFDQNGSNNLLGAQTIWGIVGDNEADVNSSHQLLVTNPPYPNTAVPITASATGTTAATTATLTNVTGHTTYICGFSIRANATAAATGNATITGTITGTLNFTQWTAPLASGLGITENTFTPCVPASAVSTSIAVISAAPGTGGVVSVTAWGFSI